MQTKWLVCVIAVALTGPAAAETILAVDGSAPIAPVATNYLKLGSATAPNGVHLDANNMYLSLAGHPWLPVMGEIHFVRLPRAEWPEALEKIKASGVDIVSTYLFWDYHEETPGRFDWSGDRDVRAFVELAAAKGLKVVIRLGPWAHGEVRYGGVPDWVVRQLPTRASDPVYLGYVERYWGEVAKQLKGLLWKDGGPIIGVQLENEYNLTGPGRGRDHIADLKALALKHGFDVPFYTVTGWDNTVYPRREVLPVFGGYPDEPWGLTADRLPPKETYAFRFDSRVSGNLGAQTGQAAGGDADVDIAHTPFLGAEFGGGVPTMYRRRPIITPDDIASMLPVQLGSGVNLYGYYMFYGGRNLIQRTTMQEATAIGGYNDLPIIDYDFQAPFGEYGQANPVLDRIRPFHYFLQSYGAALAPMTVRRPAAVPRGVEDLQTPRFALRAAGDSGFLFVNNHVRQYRMAPQSDVRFAVRLPGGTVTFPSRPVTIPSDAYFIWPIGLDLGGVRLAYASAQPVTRLDTPQGPVHVFAAIDGIAPEFAFGPDARVTGHGIAVSRVDGRTIVTGLKSGTSAMISVAAGSSQPVRILVLTQAQARRIWRVEIGGQDRLALSDDELAGTGEGLSLVSRGDNRFAFSIFPAPAGPARANLAIEGPARDGVFARYTAAAPVRTIAATVRLLRAAGTAPPPVIGGAADRVVEPYPESFGRAAAWTISLPRNALDGLDDAFLRIDWAGDVGRLFSGAELIDDRYYDGRVWPVGLKRVAPMLGAPLTFTAMPLRAGAPIYIDAALRPKIAAGGQIAELRSVTIEPQYRLTVSFER